jgi:superfamily II DNA or RNA helicase
MNCKKNDLQSFYIINNKMQNYIYIRKHTSYENCVKLGSTNNIPERNNTYLTGEMISGFFSNVFQIIDKNALLIERILQTKLSQYHIQKNGGTEFYLNCIIQLIEPILNELGVEYKKLSLDEINALTRNKRKYKINIKALIQQLKNINPRNYQLDIIQKSYNHLLEFNKGILVLSCGSGKTLISLWIAKKMQSNKILIGVPNLTLIDQWEKEIKKLFNIPILKVSKDCKKTQLQKFFTENKKFIVITTYMSSMKLLPYHFDLKILDECHHLTTANLLIDSEERKFAQMHNIIADYQLGLTATMKLMNVEDTGFIANDNELYFGEVIHKINTFEAIQRNIICDYVVNALITEENELDDIIEIMDIPEGKKGLFLAAYCALKSLAENNTNHLLVYCNTNENATLIMNMVKNMLEKGVFSLDNFFVNTYFGEDSAIKRKKTLDKFISSSKAIICCVYCLGEGWDLPLLDGVVFAENMTSGIRIVQAALRPCRKNQSGKIAKIIIPMLYNNDLLTDEENPDFKKIRQILYQLGLDDVSIMEKLRVFGLHIQLRNRQSGNGLIGIEFGEYDEEITEKLRLGMIERTQCKLSYNRVKGMIAGKCGDMEEYGELCKNDFRLPKNPEQYFGNEFIDWVDYLNIPNKYYNLQTAKRECQNILQKNPEIRKMKYSDICQEIKKIDDNFPPAEFWLDYYKVNNVKSIIGHLSIIKHNKLHSIILSKKK